MEIVFLKPTTLLYSSVVTCGDGCCSWNEWYTDTFLEGETIDSDRVVIEDLTEGVDFKYDLNP